MSFLLLRLQCYCLEAAAEAVVLVFEAEAADLEVVDE